MISDADGTAFERTAEAEGVHRQPGAAAQLQPILFGTQPRRGRAAHRAELRPAGQCAVFWDHPVFALRCA